MCWFAHFMIVLAVLNYCKCGPVILHQETLNFNMTFGKRNMRFWRSTFRLRRCGINHCPCVLLFICYVNLKNARCFSWMSLSVNQVYFNELKFKSTLSIKSLWLRPVCVFSCWYLSWKRTSPWRRRIKLWSCRPSPPSPTASPNYRRRWKDCPVLIALKTTLKSKAQGTHTVPKHHKQEWVFLHVCMMQSLFSGSKGAPGHWVGPL